MKLNNQWTVFFCLFFKDKRNIVYKITNFDVENKCLEIHLYHNLLLPDKSDVKIACLYLSFIFEKHSDFSSFFLFYLFYTLITCREI